MSVSAGLSAEPLCIECGGHVSFDGLAVGLYAEPSSDDHLDSLRLLGEFCSECAGRFTEKTARGSAFDPGLAVSPQGARTASLKAAKRLRKLARDLENAEYGVG